VTFQDKTVLVCGASNLAVDNLLERLTLHHVPVTRIGHPARVLSSLHTSTLDYQTTYSDAGMIARDIKKELEQTLEALQKGKIRGKERFVFRLPQPRPPLIGGNRREKWDQVRDLRKEYRKREGTVVKGVVGKAKVVLSTCHGCVMRNFMISPLDAETRGYSAGGRHLDNMIFDVVVIDEATQALEAVRANFLLGGLFRFD
jgi:DNA polymerase alpha-associated DNA helicase A